MLGKAPAAEMLAAVEPLMKRLRSPINAEKTRCCRISETSMTFLGYRIGRNHRRDRHGRRASHWLGGLARRAPRLFTLESAGADAGGWMMGAV